MKTGESVTNTRYTPPSPIKATPTSIASNSDDVSTASVSKAGDVTMTSSSQKSKTLKKNNILPNKDPPEGRTNAIVAVMRGRPKHGHHYQCRNKHYKQKLMRVLLDSGSDGDLVLGCLFLQETSGFLFFLLLWHFFHRNHDSCSAVTLLERHQETCLYGATVESYIGYQFV